MVIFGRMESGQVALSAALLMNACTAAKRKLLSSFVKSSPTAFPFRASEPPLLDDRFLTFRRTVREIAKSSRALWSALVPSTSWGTLPTNAVKQKYAIGASSALPLWYSSSCESIACATGTSAFIGLPEGMLGYVFFLTLTLTLAVDGADRIVARTWTVPGGDGGGLRSATSPPI